MVTDLFLYDCHMINIIQDHWCSVWTLFKIKHIEQIESVQRRATKQLPGMKNKSYPERLRKLKLPTLSYRRLRGDMIEVYKMVNGLYDSEVGNILHMWHEKKKELTCEVILRTCLRKNSFVLRVVGTWNGLPSSIVTAPSINSFKNRLHRYWSNQDIAKTILSLFSTRVKMSAYANLFIELAPVLDATLQIKSYMIKTNKNTHI